MSKPRSSDYSIKRPRVIYSNEAIYVSKSSTGYQAIHPLQILEDAEDLLQGVPVDDPEQKMKLQKHYAYLVGKFKHQITFRDYETN